MRFSIGALVEIAGSIGGTTTPVHCAHISATRAMRTLTLPAWAILDSLRRAQTSSTIRTELSTMMVRLSNTLTALWVAQWTIVGVRHCPERKAVEEDFHRPGLVGCVGPNPLLSIADLHLLLVRGRNFQPLECR